MKKSSKANLPLNPLLASSVLSGKARVAGAEQLVHLFECTSLGLGDTEVHPDDTNGRDGTEENLREGQFGTRSLNMKEFCLRMRRIEIRQ
jgi:hypothetical protein